MSLHKFTLNNQPIEIEAPDEMPLLWVIRDLIGLTGTKFSCGIGMCGSCTVHLDGTAIRACIERISSVNGRSVTTIEGLADNDRLHPVQQAWLDNRVSQCGFCQPGMIMQATSLLNNNPTATIDELESGMNGNLCRCGTYPRVRKALIQLTGREEHEH